MAKIYKIHPSIGFGRVGNLDLTIPIFEKINQHFRKEEYKIGGKIVPYPARFQIWEHETNTAGEIIKSTNIDVRSPNVEKIEWRVHLANKKAAFYKFMYRMGDDSPNTLGLRNRNPKQWIIDPGAMTISGTNIYNKKIIYRKTRSNQRIPTLQIGSLWTDYFGELYVFGGKGTAKSASRPPKVLTSDTFNTETWYDDVSDGPVTVYLKFKDAPRPVQVEPSWVIIGPPDYAPGIENIVTLYDLLADLLVRNVIKLTPDNQKLLKNYLHLHEIFTDFKANGFANLSSYKPHFHDDILPLLMRGHLLKYVSGSANSMHFANMKAPVFDTLPDAERKNIFNQMRIPPTGLGGRMPLMHGDSYSSVGKPDRYLFITKTQHELLRLWSEGKFIKSSGPNFISPPFLNDFAALNNNTVGGALGPGIQVSWLFRNPKIYSSPFRIDHSATEKYNAPGFRGSTIKPGHFTRQMANPWQADFMSCVLTDGFAWWPAQRPDDVFTSSDFTKPMVPWLRDSAGNPLSNYQQMVDKWHEMGFVLKDSSGGYIEKLKN